MRDENDEVAEARFRSVLAADDSFSDRSPVSWSDLIPSWPDDVDLPDPSPPDVARRATPAAVPVAPTSAELASVAAMRQSWQGGGEPRSEVGREPRLGAAGAFGGRLAAFDLGRTGVKALAAVAVLVVVIAGFLAWRARPQTETLAPDEPKLPAAVRSEERRVGKECYALCRSRWSPVSTHP